MQFLKDFRPEITIASPGRINLIGEHTDYNMGYVLPTAIEMRILLKFQKNGTESTCLVYSKDFDLGFTFDLKSISISANAWENYILGVINELMKRTDVIKGFDCVLESNLPLGSGLSSSAALECGIAFGLNELFALTLSKLDIVSLSQIAEHTYVGTQCGIMDQFASVMSVKDHMILLDCRTLEHRLIPMDLGPYKIIMLNTGVSHNLANSEYNVRKQECEEGVLQIKKKYATVASLRDVSKDMLVACKNDISELVYRRCNFIVQENQRVLETVTAIQQSNLKKVGELLYLAHEGISKDYQVSCAESDFLVEFSKENPAVLGARQTGGGFGGCILNIVHEAEVANFQTSAAIAYLEKFGKALTSFEVTPSSGTRVV
ncbi:MAG: galactokinase [Flavobacteriaceae bacterium]